MTMTDIIDRVCITDMFDQYELRDIAVSDREGDDFDDTFPSDFYNSYSVTFDGRVVAGPFDTETEARDARDAFTTYITNQIGTRQISTRRRR